MAVTVSLKADEDTYTLANFNGESTVQVKYSALGGAISSLQAQRAVIVGKQSSELDVIDAKIAAYTSAKNAIDAYNG